MRSGELTRGINRVMAIDIAGYEFSFDYIYVFSEKYSLKKIDMLTKKVSTHMITEEELADILTAAFTEIVGNTVND